MLSAFAALCAPATSSAEAPPGTVIDEAYTLFESGPVRALALDPAREALAVVNTPDNRVELFALDDDGRLVHRGAVAVGYEPVAVAWRHGKELWVVNHVSDSVSVVAVDRAVLAGRAARAVGQVVHTLLVGDEPRDIVFAGRDRGRAFITSARRGQNTTPERLGPLGVDPALSTPGVGRAVVWVFDANVDPRSDGGRPLTHIELFTDTPRALAASPDGRTVYAAGFMTGNRTASVPVQERVFDGGARPIEVGGVVNQPTSAIVRAGDDGRWRTAAGEDWSASIRFELPDADVFAIDAMADPPRARPEAVWRGVGTALFGMAVDPADGRLWVAQTDARNHAGDERDVACDVHRPGLSALGPGGAVQRFDLNPHLPDDRCATTDAQRALTLALPNAIAIPPSGAHAFVAAMGSDAVGLLDLAAVESGQRAAHDIVPVSGGGPTGVAFDELRYRLYVTTRYDNGVSVIDPNLRAELQHVTLPSPEPAEIIEGRRWMYDARQTSASGEVACASCHAFGHTDQLAWDLGNPEAEAVPTVWEPFIPRLFALGIIVPRLMDSVYLHQQMKGAMFTQSLRGLDNHGPMHWRGDRYDPTVADRPVEEAGAQPNDGLYDEFAALMTFNGTFVSLHGLPDELPEADMEALTRFTLALTYPPNAVRRLDNALTPEQAAGARRFTDRAAPADAIGPCSACHVLDPTANADFGLARPGFFGTDGQVVFDALNQLFKVPHLRNLYDKVGLFGASEFGAFVQPRPLYADAAGRPIPAFAPMGPQVRGFGFLHDGSADSVRRYMSSRPFAVRPPDDEEIPFVGHVPKVGIPEDDAASRPRRELEAFLFAFPGELAPIVGQQVTVGAFNRVATAPRLRLLLRRAELGDCALVARTVRGGREVGLLYVGAKGFVDDLGRPSTLAALVDRLAPGEEVTFTCAVPGAGFRLALDRDQDCALDGEERHFGTDPADPNQRPRQRLPWAPGLPPVCDG